MNAQRSLLAVAVVLVSLTLSAQQRLSESVQVNIVEVPVTVVGSDGNPVRGLTKEQFELYDDGKRVQIDAVEMLDMNVIARGERKAPLPPAANRTFLLLFDLANSTPGTIARAAEAAAEFVDKQLLERDLVGVATFTAEQGARMITGFTTDRALVRTSIQSMGKLQYFKVADPLMISFKAMETVPESLRTGTIKVDGKAEGALAAMKEDVSVMLDEQFAASAKRSNRAAQIAEDAEMRNRLRIQLGQMATVARALNRLHGRKQIILLSEGFDAKLVQGRGDLAQTDSKREEADAAMKGELWTIDADQIYGSSGASRDVNEMAELFRRSDVVLHAIDIKGLRGGVNAADAHGASRGRSNEALFLITRPTGGTVFQNANDLEATFARMLKQQEIIYLLSFTARTTGEPGKFHPLKVKVKAPGSRVTHRSGYYEALDRMTQIEKTINLTEILMNDMPVNDVGMSMVTAALPGSFVEQARVPVVVEIPGPKFLGGVQSLGATAHLFIYAFDRNNQVQDYLSQRIALDLTQAAATVRDGGIRYFGTLHLPPGEYAVKAVVRVEESGRVGFVRNDVRVPDFEQAGFVQPLFLADTADWVMLAGPTRGDQYAYPFAAGGTRYVPRARPAIVPGSTHKLALLLHRMPAENLGVTPTLTSADGTTHPAQVKLVGRTSADEQGGAKLLFDFTAGKLQPGDYELRFTVKPKDGPESVVTLPFRIL